jgi:A/G-specific adenine glycosylase
METKISEKESRRRLPRGELARREAAALRRRLLRWYDLHRRDLPWRRTADPYRIWVSEVMLQQTRAQAVVPYYERFLRRFPDVERLAEAPESELLACWSGLGYYSRAHNLQRAARKIVGEHEGRFPRRYEQALRLPGVGVYTAAAVLSIAFGQPLPVVDGNVARVLARLHTLTADPRTARGKAELLRLAAGLISRQRPGDFNQAVMELGATICQPRQPMCDRCPLRPDCRACRQNVVQLYPRPRRRTDPVLRRFVAALIQDRAGRVLMMQRPERGGWLRGFWELPMWETTEKAALPGLVLQGRLGTVRHSITENRLEVTVFGASLRSKRTAGNGRWVPASALNRLPVTTIARKAIALLESAGRSLGQYQRTESTPRRLEEAG